MAGDLNARIKNLNDFVLDDNLLFIFGDDVPYPEDDFNMPRLSKDTEYNRFGLSFIELCCTYMLYMFSMAAFFMIFLVIILVWHIMGPVL